MPTTTDFEAALMVALKKEQIPFRKVDRSIALQSLGVSIVVDATQDYRGTHRVAVSAAMSVGDLVCNVMGFGLDDVAATMAAARQWVQGVYPVLHSWKQPTHAKHGVVQRYLRATDPETGESYGWRIHVGPQVASQLDALPPLPPVDEVLGRLLRLLRQLPAATTPYWVETSVTRSTKSDEATCTISGGQWHGDLWPQAAAALKEWIGSWQLGGGVSINVKQFLLLEPFSDEQAHRLASPIAEA